MTLLRASLLLVRRDGSTRTAERRVYSLTGGDGTDCCHQRGVGRESERSLESFATEREERPSWLRVGWETLGLRHPVDERRVHLRILERGLERVLGESRVLSCLGDVMRIVTPISR